MGVLLAIGAAVSRGLRNIEKSEAYQVTDDITLSSKGVDSFPDVRF